MMRPFRRSLIPLFLIIASPAALRAADRIVVDVKINDKPVEMAVDTAASHIFLLSPAAKRIGLPVGPTTRAAGALNEYIIGETPKVDFEFSGLRGRDSFMVIDPAPGIVADVDGTIGWGPFRRNIIFFDAENKRVSYHASVPADLTGWTKLRVRPDNVLLFDVPLPEGKSGTVLVDSGDSGGIALGPQLWKEFDAANSTKSETLASSWTIGAGLVVAKERWASDLSIGNLTFHDVPVTPATPDVVANNQDYMATIGCYALKRMQLIVDSTNEVAYMKPAKLPQAPYRHNRLGAVFAPEDLQHDPLLAHVVPNSPAAQAGIKDGDVLKMIGNLNVTKWRTKPGIVPIGRFFELPAGTTVMLTIEREGKERDVSVVLKDLIGPTTRPGEPGAAP